MFSAEFSQALRKGLNKEKEQTPSSAPAKTGDKNGYLYATQDGAAIILNGITPPNILGLFTERLKTCIGIFMWGTKGMVLIHDTGMLSLEGMEKIMITAGDIKSCVIAYNPQFDGHQKKIARIMPLLKKCNVDKNYKTIEALQGGAFAPVEVSEVEAFILPAKLSIQPLHMEIRHWINIINNFFHRHDQPITPDLQFDGTKMLDIPSLISPDQINAERAYHLKIAGEKEFTRMLNIHALFWRELSVDAKVTYPNRSVRLNEFKAVGMQNLADLEVWLQKQGNKRASSSVTTSAAAPPVSTPLAAKDDTGTKLRKTSAGQVQLTLEQYKKLVQKAKEEKVLDNTSTNGRTALHWATIKENVKFVECLLDAKVDVTKVDNEGHTAAFYAKSDAMKKLFGPVNSSAAINTAPTAVVG